MLQKDISIVMDKKEYILSVSEFKLLFRVSLIVKNRFSEDEFFCSLIMAINRPKCSKEFLVIIVHDEH